MIGAFFESFSKLITLVGFILMLQTNPITSTLEQLSYADKEIFLLFH